MQHQDAAWWGISETVNTFKQVFNKSAVFVESLYLNVFIQYWRALFILDLRKLILHWCSGIFRYTSTSSLPICFIALFILYLQKLVIII